MEKTLDQAEDPIYAESVMKRALATMYIGTLIRISKSGSNQTFQVQLGQTRSALLILTQVSVLMNIQTTSTLDTFFLAMTLHPDILVQAQRSVDRACPGRLPDFSDYDSLYYIHAIVKECLRWHPVIAMSMPSCSE